MNRITPVLLISLAASAVCMQACTAGPELSHVPAGTEPLFDFAQIQVEIAGDGADDLLDFGEVAHPDQRSMELVVRNIGREDLHLRDLRIVDSVDFEISNLSEIQWMLRPDETTPVVLTYTPSEDGLASGDVAISSNDPDDPEILVALQGDGLAGVLEASPQHFDFGRPRIGCLSTASVSITNSGRAALTLSSITLQDHGGLGEFALVTAPPAETVLEPGAFAAVEVRYEPLVEGPASATLHVVSTDPVDPEASSSFSADAVTDLAAADLFVQAGNNDTDILLVVDDSASMGAEQETLQANLGAYLESIHELGIDYQLGVTSTDIPTVGGVLQGAVPIIEPGTSNPDAAFLSNLDVGLEGSDYEAGFEAAYLALSSPNTDPGAPNEGFLRESAGLQILFVSDENDHSSSYSSWTKDDYIDWFRSLKVNPQHVQLSNISGGMSGCSGPGGIANPGLDYMAAATQTSGVAQLICSLDWSTAVDELGSLSQHLSDTFDLSSLPLIESIEVEINGFPTAVGWSYEPELNAVVFEPAHVPVNGAAVQIQYLTDGVCGD